MKRMDGQISLFDLDTWSGRMFRELSVPPMGKTSGRSLRRLSALKPQPVMCLNLTPGAGDLLGRSYWEINSAWLGESWMLNTGESPSVVVESSLSQILEVSVPQKYYLSRKACQGILRRMKSDRPLPEGLEEILRIQAEIT